MPAAESYPDDLRYHREHDWARIDGDEATLGITWFAADALGDLVHFEAPEAGAPRGEGSVVRRGRVGEGGLGRDRTALRGDRRRQRDGRLGPRNGQRGSVRGGLAHPHPARRSVRARRTARRRGLSGVCWRSSERCPGTSR